LALHQPNWCEQASHYNLKKSRLLPIITNGARRYATLMLPIVLVLEKNVKANATCEPETPAEAAFMAEVSALFLFSLSITYAEATSMA
jgi:hypothetical protein